MTYRPKHPSLITAKKSIVAGAARGGERQRARLLAYAYLRGKTYQTVEQSTRTHPVHMDSVLKFASAYVTIWSEGDIDDVKWWRRYDDDVVTRVKLWAATCLEGRDAVVRCPDLLAPDVERPEPVRAEAPFDVSAESGQLGRGVTDLLAQVRSWIDH